MYTSGVQCITQNKVPNKLPRTKQFGHLTISNQLSGEFDAWTKTKQTKLYWKKIKCENWVNSTSQGNLTSAGFRICEHLYHFNLTNVAVLDWRGKESLLCKVVRVLKWLSMGILWLLKFTIDVLALRRLRPFLPL